MSLIGQAIGNLASKSAGQFLLELPDDLPPIIAEGIVDGANRQVPSRPPFALFLHDNRSLPAEGIPSVDFRELAGYREGNHVAVVFASDNRGMSTYTSVYPLLFPSGFPGHNGLGGANGVASLSRFLDELASVLSSQCGGRWTHRDFAKVFVSAAEFLTSAYQHAGNGQTSVASAWWQHLAYWVDSLHADLSEESHKDLIPAIYGNAGLPVPANGHELAMRPSDYVKVLSARWFDVHAVSQELARLDGIGSASSAVASLAEIDWDQEIAEFLLRTDSQIARVALAGVSRNPVARRNGWGSLSETDFEAFANAKGKLSVRLEGGDLPLPWAGAFPVLRISPAADGFFDVADLGLLVPWKSDPVDQSTLGALKIEVKGLRGALVEFAGHGQELSADGVLFIGRLRAKPSIKAPAALGIEVRVTGSASNYLVDRSDCSVALLSPAAVLLQARRSAIRSGNGRKNTFAQNLRGSSPITVKLGAAGLYEFAVAIGKDLQEAGAQVALSSVDFDDGWPNCADLSFRFGRGELAEDQLISLGGHPCFELELDSSQARAISPIIAAARGTLPDHTALIDRSYLGSLEEQMLDGLAAAKSGQALGVFISSDTSRFTKYSYTPSGVAISDDLFSRISELTPSAPSNELIDSAPYKKLLSAYIDLGIIEYISNLEIDSSVSGVTPSRISLAFIDFIKIEKLLNSYNDLIDFAKDLSSSDFFWAKHPFSIAIFPDDLGNQSAAAILLSPLHPIRLAWMWRLHTGLGAASDDGENAVAGLALLDGSLFPANSVTEDAFGSQAIHFIPAAILSGPEDVYCGWQAMVRIVDNAARPPQRVNGQLFPAEGLSGLSAAAVSSAIDDFLRVSPQVTSLKIALEAVVDARRSTAIDDGLLTKIAEFSRRSTGLGGIGGVTVIDSLRRQGTIPTFEKIKEELTLAPPGFNVQWSRAARVTDCRVHLTFLEGVAASLAIVPNEDEPVGWLPKVPLRRFPTRRRPRPDQATLCYALGCPPSKDRFWDAIRRYETDSCGRSFELRVRPNLTALPSSPNWLIAGDFGIDPQAMASSARTQGGGRYMLWDWRPSTTIRPNSRHVSVRVQPYFVMASIPPALTSSVASRIQKLNRSLDPVEVGARVQNLVTTLSTRAVGLNTLLAIGHHQATGALGFFFALRSLEKWVRQSGPNELRLVIPIDAVDDFLRSVSKGDPSNLRRADLLLIVINTVSDIPEITLVPTEIKHYGINHAGSKAFFPSPGDPDLKDHLEQLKSYQARLTNLCADYRAAADTNASIIGQQLSSVLDAALQLSPIESASIATRVLASTAAGTANIDVGKGLLVWFQAGASMPDGAKAAVEEPFCPQNEERVDVWIDPAFYDEEFWGQEDAEVAPGGAHGSLIRAIEMAVGIQKTGGDPSEAVKVTPVGARGDRPHTSNDNTGDVMTVAEERRRAQVYTEEEEAGAPISNDQTTGIAPTAAAMVGVAISSNSASPKRMSDEKLGAMYRDLLAALAEFKVSVQRPDHGECYIEGPAFIEFAVKPAYGVSVSRIESQLENVKLRLRLSGDSVIGCSNHLGNVLLTVPKNDPDRYFVSTNDLWCAWARPETGFCVPLGEDIRGHVVSIEFSSPNSPHLLIAGTTGSGKSEALLALLRGAAHFYGEDELQLRLIDPKGTELISLQALPHCKSGIGGTAADAIEMMADAADEMERRYALFVEHKVRDIGEYQAKVGAMPRQLLVLDEYADLTTDDEDRKKIERELKRLAQKARAAGIHVIISTQKPVVTVLNTVIKGNLPARVALRVSNGAESRVVLDEAGAEQLAGKGDAILKVGNTKTRLQFAKFYG